MVFVSIFHVQFNFPIPYFVGALIIAWGEHFWFLQEMILLGNCLSLQQGYHFIHLRKPCVQHLKALASQSKVASSLCIIFFAHQNLVSQNRNKFIPAFTSKWLCLAVKVITDKISKRSKGYAFVEYTTEEAASAALKEMNGKVDSSFLLEKCSFA